MDWPSLRTTCHGNALHICWQCTQVFQEGRCCKVEAAFKYLFQSQFSGHSLKKEREIKKKSLPSTHLAVLMGLGSKLPCKSTNVCFSSVPSRLASTKSGGRAPAMAHRHDLVILKSSASYFYRGRQTQQEGGSETGFFFPPPIFTAAGMYMVSREMDRASWAESGEEKWRMATWKTESWRSVHQAMSCHKLINDSSIMVLPQLHRSQALHWVFTSLSVATETFSSSSETASWCGRVKILDRIMRAHAARILKFCYITETNVKEDSPLWSHFKATRKQKLKKMQRGITAFPHSK